MIEYTAKLERITYNDNPKLYDLEDRVHQAFKEVLNHRVAKYNEDYWHIALPTELFSFLDGWDKKAVKEAIRLYQEVHGK